MSSQPLTGVMPYLIFRNAAAAMDFYAAAFGAVENFRLSSADGKIAHAELSLNGATIMLADEHPDFGALSPQAIGGCPIKLHFYVADVDADVARAVAAGATVVREPKLEFYGDRTAMVADPFGYTWSLATRVEDVSPEEMQRRWSEMTNA